MSIYVLLSLRVQVNYLRKFKQQLVYKQSHNLEETDVGMRTAMRHRTDQIEVCFSKLREDKCVEWVASI